MSNKAIALLKVLLHGDIHLDEITKYVDLDINSIERNISVLNEYLCEKGIKPIKKVNNMYSLENRDEKFSEFFSKLDILSSRERQDIYCIRLLLNGHINLEKERQAIGVSRTTAIKDLKKVREFLEGEEIIVESRNSKGIFLKEVNEGNLYNILCEKIMKLFIDREFLSKQRKELLEEINILEEEKYLEVYTQVTEKFGLKKSMFSFYAIYAMGIIERIKGSIVYNIHEIDKHKEFDNISKKLEKIKFKFKLSSEFKRFLVSVILKIKYNCDLTPSLKENYERFINRVQEIFQLNDEEKKGIYIKLLNCYVIGYLDKKYGVLWVRKSPNSERCKRLGKIVEDILKELETDMIYSDILRLAGCITNFFMIEEYTDGFKVLSVSRNIDNEYSQRVINSMKVFYPKISFTTQSFLEFRFKDRKEIESYDLIISDTESYSIKNLRKVNTLSLREIQRCFIEYVLDKRFLKLKK
ncbi:BglG family transcription antiterminator [Cetobacterium somerae]